MERNPSSSAGTQDTVAATEPVATSDTPAMFDRYRAGGLIGRGGMGEVLSARDEHIGRSVAIKRLRTRDAAPEVVARFLREARIQGRLEHPAIVPVHELHDASDEPYFVMKQLAGTTLHEVIGMRPRNVLLRAFVDVCLAIEFAHARGVIHRDLKPANIMLGDFGEVYVLDWGIARVADEASRQSFADIDTLDGATQAGTVLGTPGYMSPEQIRGDADLDGRSDVYALGCILFEILAGKPLHPRGQAGLASALAGVEARPSKLADVPPELDAVCATATAAARDARFASARALADAVQRYLDGDRDLAMRRDLSRAELGRARDALARNDRVEALRAAGRAVALDPHAREPAELVARLMLEPPEETPAEVEAELAAIDHADTHRQARRGGASMLAALLFLPFMYLSGLHDTWYIAAVCALVGTDFAMTRFKAWGSAPLTWFAIAVNSAFVLVIAQLMTPLLAAPGIAIIMGALLAAVPRLRPVWLLYAALVVPLLALWGAQLIGWLPRTIEVVGDGIVLHAETTHIDASWGLTGLALWLVAAPAIAIALTRGIVRDRLRLQRTLQLQSWQLRQLVPRA